MKIYAVAKWDRYYPLSNNVIKVFTTYSAANEYLDILQKEDQDTGWEAEYYDVFEYSVIEENNYGL